MKKILIIAGPNGAEQTTFAIPATTIRRRFQRGLVNLRNHYLGIVDEWSIYDGSQRPPLLLDTGDRNELDNMMTRFKKTAPEFYKTYFSARVVVKRAATHAPAKKEDTPPA